jgi:hypothetical protein
MTDCGAVALMIMPPEPWLKVLKHIFGDYETCPHLLDALHNPVAADTSK